MGTLFFDFSKSLSRIFAVNQWLGGTGQQVRVCVRGGKEARIPSTPLQKAQTFRQTVQTLNLAFDHLQQAKEN